MTLNIAFIIILFTDYWYSSNIRGTKEILLKNNQFYFLEKEIETSKELRNLSSKDYRLIFLCINCGSFIFILLLSSSFSFKKTKCSDECPCDNHNNNNSAGNGNAGEQCDVGFVFVIIIFFFFYAIYGSAYSCGI